MTKLYNVAYLAQNNGHVVYGAALIWADSLAEATGLATLYAQEKHPDFYNHQAKAFLIDQQVIDQAYVANHNTGITINLNKD
jgi:hypothetical protein